MNISSLTSYQYNDLRSQAQTLINAYDRDGDGRLSRYEAQQTASYGGDSYSFNTRLNSSYVQRTTIYQTTYGHLNADLVESADRNYDGTVDADELVQNFLERGGDAYGTLRTRFESRNSVESDRSTTEVYDPSGYYPADPYPYNPYSDPYRPTPPVVVVTPSPYTPYSPGPTPPSPDYYRPTPPPVSSRPTPPSPGYTPSVPSSRPTPPVKTIAVRRRKVRPLVAMAGIRLQNARPMPSSRPER